MIIHNTIDGKAVRIDTEQKSLKITKGDVVLTDGNYSNLIIMSAHLRHYLGFVDAKTFLSENNVEQDSMLWHHMDDSRSA